MDSSQLRAFQEAVSQLQNQVNAQQAQIQLLQAPRQSSKPKPSLPDPDKFGGHANKFDTWLPSIKAKLRVDSEAIGDATAQFYYVYLNLESQVQAMVMPQLAQAEAAQQWDPQSILNQLSRVYENPNRVQEAEDRLLSLKQAPTESMPAYIAKFERCLYEAQGQGWPDVNKISAFRNGLSSQLRNRLAQQLSLPRDYAGFIRVVQQLAGRSFAYTSTSTTHTSTHAQGHGHGNTTGEPMQIGALWADKDREEDEEQDLYETDSEEEGSLIGY